MDPLVVGSLIIFHSETAFLRARIKRMAPFRRANIVYVSIPNARGFFRPLRLEQWMLISNDTEKTIHYIG
jgi:acyl-CoA thioesterase